MIICRKDAEYAKKISNINQNKLCALCVFAARNIIQVP